MIKIITLANLQLFLTKCKTLFASKKHTHTAADITGLPSGGGADSTRYTVDEHGYTVIKDKYGNDAFWANGVNRELRDSKGNTAVRIKNPEGLLPNNLGGGVEINYGKNANGTVEKAIVTSDTNVQVKTPDGNTVARIEDGKTSWKTPTSTTDAIQLTPTKSYFKFNNKGLEVNNSRATLTHAKEVLLNSEAGSGASLRLSEKDVHLDGIDGGMMVMCRPNSSGLIANSLNFPQKRLVTDTTDTNTDIESPAIISFLRDPALGNGTKIVQILGDVIETGSNIQLFNNNILGFGTNIGINYDSVTSMAGSILLGSMPTFGYPYDIRLNVFTTPQMPSFSFIGKHINQDNISLNVITIPDDETTNIDSFISLISDEENGAIITNESGTQSWIAESKNRIYPSLYPIYQNGYDADVTIYNNRRNDSFFVISINPTTEKIALLLHVSETGEYNYDTSFLGADRFLDMQNAFNKLIDHYIVNHT